MEAKTFRAATTQEALELVQNELGAEAIIVSVRQIPGGAAWQTWKTPGVEVLAMPASKAVAESGFYQPEELVKKTKHQKTAKISSSRIGTDLNPAELQAPSDGELQNYLSQLAMQIAQARKPETKPVPGMLKNHYAENDGSNRPTEIPLALIQIKKTLQQQGLELEFIRSLLVKSSEILSPETLNDEPKLRYHIQKQLEASIRILKIEKAAPDTQAKPRVVFILGTSGSGKTSVCAKLASRYHIQENRKIAWICADTIHAGAIHQARTYTESLGIPLFLAYTPQELTEIVARSSDYDLILVDTPARNPYAAQEIVELGSFLSEIPHKILFLTLPATSKENDLHEALVAFTPFHLDGLIITKVDETRTFGDVFNLVRKNKNPIAYFTNGTGVLENLHSANASILARLLFNESI